VLNYKLEIPLKTIKYEKEGGHTINASPYTGTMKRSP
jgi:hypothetical protein